MIRNLTDVILLVLTAAWRRRYLVIIPMLLLPPLAWYAGGKVPKSYQTRMSILIQEPAALNPFLEDFALSPNLKERMAPLKTLLKSRHVLSDVLRDLGVIDEKTSELDKSREIRKLAGSINSSLVGKEVINLTIKGSESKGLAKRLNAVAKRFIDRIVAPERSSVEGSEKFLREQLLARQKQLQDAEARLAAFKVANAEDLPEIYKSNITRLTALQDSYDTRLIELEAARRSLSDLKKRLSGTNPLVGNLEEKIVDLSSELVSLKARYTDDHSKVRSAETKLARLKAERSALVSVTKDVSDGELDRLFAIAMGKNGGVDDLGQSPFLVSQMLRLQDAQDKKVALEKEVEQIRLKIIQLNEGIARFGPIERKMQGLERNIRIAQQLYEKLMERYELARVTGALGRFEAPERVKIIDAPSDPLFPSSPGRILFLIGGIVGGIFLGIGLAAVTELLDTSVRSAKDLCADLELPLLSRLSYISPIAASPHGGGSGPGNPPGGGTVSIGYDGPMEKDRAMGLTKRQKVINAFFFTLKIAKHLTKKAWPVVQKTSLVTYRMGRPVLGGIIRFASSKLGILRRP